MTARPAPRVFAAFIALATVLGVTGVPSAAANATTHASIPAISPRSLARASGIHAHLF